MRLAEAVRARQSHFANAFGPPRQSSAALGRATGARPVPHSTRCAHHFSADRVIVACVSMSRWRPSKKVNLWLPVARLTDRLEIIRAGYSNKCGQAQDSRVPRHTAEKLESEKHFHNIVKFRDDGGADNRDNFLEKVKERDRKLIRYVTNGAKTLLFLVSWKCHSDLKSRARNSQQVAGVCFFTVLRLSVSSYASVCVIVCDRDRKGLIRRWWSCEEAAECRFRRWQADLRT